MMDDADATVVMGGVTASTPHTRVPSSSGGSRFAPGTLLSGRYQIIGLLGKGGMGEVYRADDLTLDQPVALKFLPREMVSNPSMLARFHSEVRLARQVSHPNVCRVYDIGETEGQLFLSMEYLDGEDLAGLLRRIGRLPSDKAIEFARKLCAGLAAAHDKGVLHRDLKPANIMIDARGQVVIMDFGLAGVAEQIVAPSEISAGTPGYMAPEQLAGREVSARSDIYALGLVLYEMFTGRRPFPGNTLVETIRLQEHSTPVSLTTVVKDMDPAVERVILRCLSPDPRQRPQSALAVAAALPGGDPLAAALAAGETPSPDMVAASGATTGIRPWLAFAIATSVAVILILITVFTPGITVLGWTPTEVSPDALSEKAREVLRNTGHTAKPADFARGFEYETPYIHYVQQNKRPWSDFLIGQPSPMLFWYRQSPRYLEPVGRSAVTLANPPETISGMATVLLDTKGRLVNLRVIPPQLEEQARGGTTAPNYARLFEQAGLDIKKFETERPQWIPLLMADDRAAWVGVYPEQPSIPLRIEAAAWRGKPIYFLMVDPWTRPTRMTVTPASARVQLVQFMLLTLLIGALLGGGLLARHNIARGRGDIRGATRLAVFCVCVYMLIWTVGGAHVPNASEFGHLFEHLGYALVIGGGVWLTYVAIEPYIRRHWPRSVVTWSRVLAGGFKDPLVGRDVLVGVLLGAGWTSLWLLGQYMDKPFGTSPSAANSLNILLGTRFAIATSLAGIPNALVGMLVSFFLLFVVRAVLRKEWLAATVFIAVFTGLNLDSSSAWMIDAPLAVLVGVTIYFVLTRAGLLAYFIAVYVQLILLQYPSTNDFSSWYSGAWIFAILIILGLTGYGLYITLNGRSIIKDELL